MTRNNPNLGKSYKYRMAKKRAEKFRPYIRQAIKDMRVTYIGSKQYVNREDRFGNRIKRARI